MVGRHWFWIPALAGVLIAGCGNEAKRGEKADPTKGTVTGTILCSDTGKPARFAFVALTRMPQKEDAPGSAQPLDAVSTTLTGLDGRFRFNAVEPGRYYVYALLAGYLDPMAAVNTARLEGLANDRERALDAIEQVKDRMAQVRVTARHAADVSLSIERGAEITGRVRFDDGSPAIGLSFALTRKTEKGDWAEVRGLMFNNSAAASLTDGHGEFRLANLPAGEYRLCAQLPAFKDESPAAIWLGDTWRRKNAKIVKLHDAETAAGTDIEIPLTGLHTVSGTVTALADGHAPAMATVRLLWADDREPLREMSAYNDGGFEFDYVPEGNFLLQVTEARDPDPPCEAHDAPGPACAKRQRYADKEMAMRVLDDVMEMKVALEAERP